MLATAAAVRAAAVVGVAAIFVSSCSNTEPSVNREPNTGSASASTVNGIQQVTLDVSGSDDRFHPSTITVHPGKVRVVLEHGANGAPHDWRLDGVRGAYVPLTEDGQTKSVTFTAPKPGRYHFVCSIHIAQGMVGTLIVTKS